MNQSIANQVVIVTGAAQGIGECVARHLARQGATLALADIQGDKVASVQTSLSQTGVNAKSYYVDIADTTVVKAAIASILHDFGRIDALVNVAGLDAPPGLAWEITEDDWRRVIDVDLNGQWWMIQAVLPHMMAQRSGKIVTISSISARRPFPDHTPAYAAAKAGLIGLTNSLATQLEAYGILVNCILPGMIGTGTDINMTQEEKDQYQQTFPLGIVGPEPVASAVSYLLAESGDWISGTAMNVSGGGIRGI
ncbi:SDR family oxidoreductase [Oculatella sp. LEGE 06141]|uniref:SDR family oxidoreductase n=1 Tax=Oculatella sp. LEGE 06141 TaxID=1828648 RepID=UPI001880A956|nr:SDR family oxidoreductase [Oculatella sp. LEGE 06141]